MKQTLPGALLLVALMTSCLKDPSVSPDPITICPPSGYLGRDSVYSGSYLNIAINDDASKVYAQIQDFRQSRGVTALNVVSNFSTDVTQLRERLPLYQYILLDQQRGTESGVQINLEADRVSSLYLNSGQKLGQWPAGLKDESAIRIGDPASALYEKLVKIRTAGPYTATFERILLLTKNISSPYDRAMGQSPQWYFTYNSSPDRMEEVQIHFQDGKVHHFVINHYQRF